MNGRASYTVHLDRDGGQVQMTCMTCGRTTLDAEPELLDTLHDFMAGHRQCAPVGSLLPQTAEGPLPAG